jgi:nicotinate-nucleotide adenylyltransferase
LRIGILGGGFNPPHLGHLILAQEALAQLELDRVMLMPYGEPSHRVLDDDPGADLRLAMCELVAAADSRLELSRIEVERGGPIYTVDTVRELTAARPDDEFVLLLGGDQAASLRTWRAPEEVLSLVVVAVAERDEWRRAEIVERLGPLCSEERLRFFDMPRIDISSSMIRLRARAGRPIRYLVPDAVADYVEAQPLYGASARAAGAVSS